MRFLILMLVAALAAPGCGAVTSAPENGEALSGIVVASGVDGRLTEEPAGRRRAPWLDVARNEQELADLWEQFVPGEPPASIDFSSSIIVFLLLGQQSTGGYAIEPMKVEIDGNRALVHAKLVQPMTPDDVTSQVLTAPYAVMRVQSRAVEKIEWINTDGRLTATKIIE